MRFRIGLFGADINCDALSIVARVPKQDRHRPLGMPTNTDAQTDQCRAGRDRVCRRSDYVRSRVIDSRDEISRFSVGRVEAKAGVSSRSWPTMLVDEEPYAELI